MKKKPRQYEYEPDEMQDMTIGSYATGAKTGTVKTRQIGFTAKQPPVKRQPKRK
jgi:hypothetical protein